MRISPSLQVLIAGLGLGAAVSALPAPASAAEISIAKRPGNGGCIATVRPDASRGAAIELSFATGNGRDLSVYVDKEPNAVQIIVGDQRRRFDGLRITGSAELRGNRMWALLSQSEFHLTTGTGPNVRSSRFNGLDPDRTMRRLHVACPPGPNIEELKAAEAKLNLDGRDRMMINWILNRDAGGKATPAEMSVSFDTAARRRIQAFAKRHLKIDTQYVTQNVYNKLLARGGFRIAPWFDNAGSFEKGVAAVKRGNRWGMVNPKMRWVVRPGYDDALGTNGGFMPVRRGNKWGVLDNRGRLTHQIRYDEILACNFQRCPYRNGAKWGYLNASGGIAIRAKYNTANHFRDGFAAVRDEFGWALIDRAGKVRGRFAASQLYSPSDSMMVFVDDNGKRGFYGLDGRIKVRPRYDQVKAFSQGLGAVRRKGKWGFVNRTGQEVVPLRYSNVGQFGDGLAPARAADGRWGYIDRRGRWAISPRFLRGFNFRDGVAIVRLPNPLKPGSTESKDLLRGFIDTSGRLVFPGALEDAYAFKEGLAPVKMLGRWGYLDRKALR